MRRDASLTITRRLVAATLALGLWSVSASGQDLPSDTVRQVGTLSDAQRDAVRAYVAGNSGDLGGADPAKVQANLKALRAPLGDAQASVSFRRAYTAELRDVLGAMLAPAAMGDAKDLRPVRALALAGELATDPGVDLILPAVASPRADVRHQAASALRATFYLQSAAPTALIDPAKTGEALGVLARQATGEVDGLVFDAQVRALAAAMEIGQARSVAMQRLCEAASGAARATASTPAAHGDGLLRAGVAVREMLSRPQAPVDRDAARAASELGGHLVGFAARSINAKRLPMVANDPARQMIAGIANTGQNVVLVAGPRLQNWSPPPPPIPEASIEGIKAATQLADAKFTVDAGNLIGPQGVLARTPFEFAPNHFTLR